jgi:hypothetical protein
VLIYNFFSGLNGWLKRDTTVGEFWAFMLVNDGIGLLTIAVSVSACIPETALFQG